MGSSPSSPHETIESKMEKSKSGIGTKNNNSASTAPAATAATSASSSSSEVPKKTSSSTTTTTKGGTSSSSTSNPPAAAASNGPTVTNSATKQQKPPLPETSNPNDELVFETFYHKNGKAYCCLYTNGMRHYLDSFESGQWLEFPFKWYDDGVLVTDEVQHPQDESLTADNNTTRTSEAEEMRRALRNKTDEREGVIKVPGRGTYQTYIFEHRRNIHCFYDPDEGAWIKLPIKWELSTELGKRMVRKVQEVVPQWLDECDIMAAVRASNYNVDDCVNTYHATAGSTPPAVSPVSLPGGGLQRQKSVIAESDSYQSLEKKLQEARRRIKALEGELESERNEKEYVRKKALEYEEQMATFKASCETAMTQLAEMQKVRPKGDRKTDWSEELQALSKRLSETKASQYQAKSELAEMKKLFADFFLRINTQVVKLTEAGKRTADQVDEYRTLYRKEALQRKLLYNQLQELRGNIRVLCRIRHDPGSSETCVRALSDSDVEVAPPNLPKKSFQFDKTFDAKSKQEEVFAEVLPLISSCADGYNVCILAYGQTGSGKTFTMQGPSDNPGVNVRAVKELLRLCKEREETISYTLTLSMLEIYNELLQDLLSPKVDVLELKAQGQKVVLPGLTEAPVNTEADIFEIIKTGESNRKVASTKMNSTSSRSHLMVQLSIVGRDKVSEVTTRGVLTLCDLAGSERVSKTEAQGARLTEAAFINKSLSSLGQVFAALRANQLHIPYRNSKLTHVLQPCLGGDAKACLVVNVSPDVSNASETISTLQFGSNAKQVALGPAKKMVERSK